MRKPTRRFREVGTVLATLALVWGLSTTATVAAPSPASAAGSSFQQCFPHYDSGGNISGFICIPIPVAMELCQPCPDFAISLEHLINPADQRFLPDLAGGLDLLGRASLAHPRDAARLRAQAQTAFLSSAGMLGGGEVMLGMVGVVDWRAMNMDPEPDPWLEAAGTSLVRGLTLAQVAIANPDPQPWIDQAMAEFDAAFAALSTHQVG